MIPINLHRMAFEWRRIQKMGALCIMGKIVIKLLGVTVCCALLPMTFLLHLLGYRYVTLFTDRIGHLALEPDCLLKEQALGRVLQKKWILLAPPGRVANEHLLSYWQPYFRIVRNRAVCFLIVNMGRLGLMRYDATPYIRAIGKAQRAYPIYSEWGNRPPLLKLTPEDEAWAEEMLSALGVPDGAWFACVHAREGGFSSIDEELHGHRNSCIKNTIPAMREVIDRGGWIIRIGDPSMTPLPAMERAIDYAHSPLKTPRLDILLCARSKFILGNTSGISLVGAIFGVPCALANMIPLSALGVSPLDISIPKCHWSVVLGRYLSFTEIFSTDISRYQYQCQFKNSGIRVDENTSDDIRDLTVEMLEKLDSTHRVLPTSTSDDDDTKLFLALLNANHYAFGATSTIGAKFLKRYKLNRTGIPGDAKL